MEINQIVEQVMSHLQDAPEKIQDVIADPKGAIEEITGQNLENVDIAEIVDQIKTKVTESGIDLGDILGNLGDVAENIGGAVSGILGGFLKK